MKRGKATTSYSGGRVTAAVAEKAGSTGGLRRRDGKTETKIRSSREREPSISLVDG